MLKKLYTVFLNTCFFGVNSISYICLSGQLLVFFVNLIVLACLFAFHILYLLLFVLLAVLNK